MNYTKMMIRDGRTWSEQHWRWVTHAELGATVTKAPKGWEKLFDPPEPARKMLKVVRIVYDWKLFTDGNYEPQGGDF